MRAYDIAACVVAGAALLLALPPLGKRLRRGLMSTPSATFSQACRSSSRGRFEKRAPGRRRPATVAS
jgi:hypothetical protein